MFLFRPFVWIWVLLRHDAAEALAALVPSQGPLRVLYRLARFLGASDAELDDERGGDEPGTRLAYALRALGPTFIKVGQIISTRADLLGDDIAQQLSVLHDQLPPADQPAIEEQFAEVFELPLDALFSDFDRDPISAASVAQVHFATTLDGQDVAVKTLRPGIKTAFNRDLVALHFWARVAETIVPPLRQLKPTALVAEFRRQVAIELDLRLEAASMSEIAALHEDDPRMVVPTVDWDRTNATVLTMSREMGIPIDERQDLIDAGLDVTEVLTQAATLFFKGVFELGVFHGDQHAGNMFIKDDGRVLFVDFGIVGRIPQKTRFFLADLMHDLLERRYDQLAQRYADEGYLPHDADVAQFALALRALAEPIMGQPLEKVSFATLLGNLLTMGRRFGLAIEPELFLLQKNMLMAEGIARSLDPNINIWTMARPLIEKWMWDNRGPQAQTENVVWQARRLANKLPDVLDRADKTLKNIEESQNRPTFSARQLTLSFLGIAAAVAVGVLLSGWIG